MGTEIGGGMRSFVPLLVLTFLFAVCCAQPRPVDVNGVNGGKDRMLPAVEAGQTVVEHKAYSLVYSEENEQPLWCAYMLTAARVNGKCPRSNDFREDPAIATGSADLFDYRGSGYSRGHLVPAADMKWDEEAMSETFLLSNMSPQTREFNDGVWNRMEQQVRNWASWFDTLYVVTGPVLKGLDGSKTIGHNAVTVPTHYYKAVYDPHRGMAIAFVVPHEQSSEPLRTFVVSVDELEQMTGLDFFPELPDEEENRVEAEKCPSCWRMK